MSHILTLTPNAAISWALKVAMLVLSSVLFFEGQLLEGLFGLLALAVSLMPALVNHNFDTNLPWPIDFWLTIWLALSSAGTAGLYQTYPWWDDVLHVGGSAVLSYLAFVLLYAFHVSGKLRLTIPFIGLFTFLIGMAFGALWELAEYWVWQLTGRDALTGTGDLVLGMLDSLSDLQLDLVGSVFIALGGMSYVARQRHMHLMALMQPFVKIFGQKVRRVQRVAGMKRTELARLARRERNKLKRRLKTGFRSHD